MSKQFIAVFLYIAAILGSYAFPDSRLVPDDEFEWPSATELVQEEGNSDFVTMVEQNPTFKKAVSTIMKNDSKAGHSIYTMMLSANKKVDYTKKHTAFVKKHKNKNYKKKGKEMESLATLLKTMSAEVLKNYGDHRKRTIERKKDLDLELKVITTEQFGKVAAKAHAWCGKWEDQQKDKKTEADKLSARTSAREQTATVKWNSDATGGLDCDYIDSTTGKPHTGNRKMTCNAKTFSPSNSFLTKWNNARNNYLRKDKSYYDARQKHIGSIQKSNDAAEGFKDGIDDLVDVKIGECKVQKKVGVLKDVREFNQHNAKLANFFRSIEVIKCHVQSIDKTHSSKNLKNSALNTCIDGLDSVADLQRKKFKNITEPTKFCPTKKEYRDKLKLKHGLDLHYTGKTNAIVTDTQGVVSTKNGWYPRTKQCADVKKHAVKPVTTFSLQDAMTSSKWVWNSGKRLLRWKNQALFIHGDARGGCATCGRSVTKTVTLRARPESLKGKYCCNGKDNRCCADSRHFGHPQLIYHFQDLKNYESINVLYGYGLPQTGKFRKRYDAPYNQYPQSKDSLSRTCVVNGRRTRNTFPGQADPKEKNQPKPNTRIKLPKFGHYFDLKVAVGKTDVTVHINDQTWTVKRCLPNAAGGVGLANGGGDASFKWLKA